MSNTLTYDYGFQSTIQKEQNGLGLILAKYSEVQKKEVPCFFWGKMTKPFILSRCLIALSNTVQSSFNLSPFQLALLKDPIVTAGNQKVRFEGFSHCAGVYVRVDVLEDGHDGEFLENGTTNVDFNQDMISSLGAVPRRGDMTLAVGKKEVQIISQGKKVVERKVPLPTKWIKGLTTVQHYMSLSEERYNLNRIQAVQLFKTIPKEKIKSDYYLTKRGNRLSFSPMKAKDAVIVGGIHRLHLLQPLLPLMNKMKVFAHNEMQSVTFQLYFGSVIYSCSLSRNAWRGFSGEGALLEELLEDIPDDLIQKMDNYSFANQEFNSTLLAIDTDSEFSKINNLTAKLSAMGLLGFELDSNQFFYRRLPFELNRILSLNPRLKGVEKLLAQDKVHITKHDGQKVEARVEGSGVLHYVVLDENEKCTCTWFSRNQGERGACKHILAVKKKIQ